MTTDSVWRTRPATRHRFEDFADVVHPNRCATHCWHVPDRLRAKVPNLPMRRVVHA